MTSRSARPNRSTRLVAGAMSIALLAAACGAADDATAGTAAHETSDAAVDVAETVEDAVPSPTATEDTPEAATDDALAAEPTPDECYDQLSRGLAYEGGFGPVTSAVGMALDPESSEAGRVVYSLEGNPVRPADLSDVYVDELVPYYEEQGVRAWTSGGWVHPADDEQATMAGFERHLTLLAPTVSEARTVQEGADRIETSDDHLDPRTEDDPAYRQLLAGLDHLDEDLIVSPPDIGTWEYAENPYGQTKVGAAAVRYGCWSFSSAVASTDSQVSLDAAVHDLTSWVRAVDETYDLFGR